MLSIGCVCDSCSSLISGHACVTHHSVDVRHVWSSCHSVNRCTFMGSSTCITGHGINSSMPFYIHWIPLGIKAYTGGSNSMGFSISTIRWGINRTFLERASLYHFSRQREKSFLGHLASYSQGSSLHPHPMPGFPCMRWWQECSQRVGAPLLPPPNKPAPCKSAALCARQNRGEGLAIPCLPCQHNTRCLSEGLWGPQVLKVRGEWFHLKFTLALFSCVDDRLSQLIGRNSCTPNTPARRSY